ncbi:MAG: SDR family NAD(P)-dependent oxidoreductase [Alphaproteobacteria bacterium]|nr:SDR family NAD(P)-dependent oxidoreductase [Alphaproteobacteria bacterium]
MSEKILVTGADGFIGSHLVELLVEDGFDVRAFAMYTSMGTHGWLDTLSAPVRESFEVVAGDIRDGGSVRSAVAGCDTVLHLAALIGIPYSYVAAESYVDTNVKGTLNVLQAARDQDATRVVCTSTSEVYGSAQFVPITEEHPVVGQSPYSASKIGADQLAISFYRSFELPVSIARPFNTYGPRQSMRAVIPTIVAQIARGETQIQLGALAPTRDFNYVRDTARGIMEIGRNDASLGEVINLGSGFEVSVGELAAMIAEVMGSNAEIILDPARVRPDASEVDRLLASNDKAKSLLGWAPDPGGREGLLKGLEATAAWFSEPENLKRYSGQDYKI